MQKKVGTGECTRGSGGRCPGRIGLVTGGAGCPKVSEIAPLMIMIKLEQYQYSEATAIAVVMLLASFALMFGINLPLGPLFGPAFGKPTWALPMVWTPLARVALPLCVMVWMFLRERTLADAALSEDGENRDGGTCDHGPLAAREAA